MLAKEIYRLDIKIGVSGDGETKKKLSATEKMAEQTKKKMQALDRITASPSVKLKDNASSTIDKIKAKTERLNNTIITTKIKAKDEASKAISNIENKINGFIKSGAKKVISLGITGMLATGGLGIGTSISTFSRYEQGLSNVKAVTGATNIEMKQLGDTAKSLGASTAWSAVQVTQAEELLGQAGFSVQETITALPGLLSLASAGSLDLAAATDIASGTLRAFSLNASESAHVADVLALSASATNSDVTDLGETMKYVAPVSASLGISLEDTAAAAGLLSNQNIKGSQAGTILRQTMARLASPTKEAAELMGQYGINAFDAHGNMKPLSSVVDNLNKSLGKLTSQQRADIISTVFGVESMSGVLALMNQGGESLSSLSKRLKDAKGAADDMAETKLDNLAGQWEQLKGAVETTQINLGERLAPYAKEFVTWLTDKMPEIENKVISTVDYLSKNTTTIKTIAGTILGLGVAFAGLSAVGKVGSTITGIKELVTTLKGAKAAEETVKLAGGLKNIGVLGSVLPAVFSPAGLAIAGTAVIAGAAVTSNANLIKKSLSTTTEELGPVERIMNRLNGTIYKSKKEMSDLGLIYDDFGNGVSDSFKTAAQDASKSLLEIEMNIKNLTLSEKMDETGISKFKNYVNDFTYQGINAIREKQTKIKSEFEKTFSLDGVMSDAEKGVMDYLGSYFEEGVNKELSIRDEIYKIGDKAIKDHGKILDSDMQNIRDKLGELKAIQLEYANAESAGEQAYAKSKFSSKAERVTGIKGASELLQERAKERQSQIDETKANYDKTITWTQSRMKNEKDPGKRAILQKGLDEATVARDKALKEAQEGWKSDLETVYKYYKNAEGKINKYNGTELTGKDVKSQNSLEQIKGKYSDLKDITQDGFYGVRDTVTGAMNSVYVTVDKTTGEITGAWEYATGQAGGYTSELKQKVEDLGTSHITAGTAMQILADSQARVNTTSGQIITSSGEVIGQLQNVSVATDGTKTGILNLNGTPIQITTNADGQIIKMQEFKGSVDNIPPNANVQISSNATEAKAPVDGLLDSLKALGSRIWTATVSVFQNIFSSEDKPSKKASSTQKIASSEGNPFHHASGTVFSNEGFSTVDERGWELSESKSVPILGRYNDNPLTYMSRGTKILNHMQSVQDMKQEVSRQVNQKVASQPQQVKYQLIKPQQQVQIAGVGGMSFGDINVNVDGNQDIDNIVALAVQEFARNLKQSLANIKK